MQVASPVSRTCCQGGLLPSSSAVTLTSSTPHAVLDTSLCLHSIQASLVVLWTATGLPSTANQIQPPHPSTKPIMIVIYSRARLKCAEALQVREFSQPESPHVPQSAAFTC